MAPITIRGAWNKAHDDIEATAELTVDDPDNAEVEKVSVPMPWARGVSHFERRGNTLAIEVERVNTIVWQKSRPVVVLTMKNGTEKWVRLDAQSLRIDRTPLEVDAAESLVKYRQQHLADHLAEVEKATAIVAHPETIHVSDDEAGLAQAVERAKIALGAAEEASRAAFDAADRTHRLLALASSSSGIDATPLMTAHNRLAALNRDIALIDEITAVAKDAPEAERRSTLVAERDRAEAAYSALESAAVQAAFADPTRARTFLTAVSAFIGTGTTLRTATSDLRVAELTLGVAKDNNARQRERTLRYSQDFLATAAATTAKLTTELRAAEANLAERKTHENVQVVPVER